MERSFEFLEFTEHKTSMLLKYINFQAEKPFWHKVHSSHLFSERLPKYNLDNLGYTTRGLLIAKEALQINNTQTPLV